MNSSRKPSEENHMLGDSEAIVFLEEDRSAEVDLVEDSVLHIGKARYC
jgi:hypothetical protein